MLEIFIPCGTHTIEWIASAGGAITYREAEASHTVLTVEFDSREKAEIAKVEAAARGFHVEGPADY